MNDYKPTILDWFVSWFQGDNDHRDNVVTWWSDKIKMLADPDAVTVPIASPVNIVELPTVSPRLWRTITEHVTQVNGPDVSRHQGDVDWSAIRNSGASFAICKASEGYGYKDPQFDVNWQGMYDAGLIRGAYHFARVNIKDAAENAASRMDRVRADALQEAQWFCDVVYPDHKSPELGDLPLVLDIEWDSRSNAKPNEIVAFCVEFVGVVKARTGRVPMVYTGPSFWKYKLAKSLELSDCHLWLVSGYKNKPGRPTNIIPGWDWTFDQYTNKYSRPDKKGSMDWNVFRGTITDLADLAGIPRDVKPEKV